MRNRTLHKEGITMSPNAKRILINHIVADIQSSSQRRACCGGATGSASSETIQKLAHAERSSTDALCTRSANGTLALIGDDACETGERQDLGGEA